MSIKSFIMNLIYDEPITIDRYKRCWECSQGEAFVIYDFGQYCGQGDYRKHIKCELFPCAFTRGIPKVGIEE